MSTTKQNTKNWKERKANMPSIKAQIINLATRKNIKRKKELVLIAKPCTLQGESQSSSTVDISFDLSLLPQALSLYRSKINFQISLTPLTIRSSIRD